MTKAELANQMRREQRDRFSGPEYQRMLDHYGLKYTATDADLANLYDTWPDDQVIEAETHCMECNNPAAAADVIARGVRQSRNLKDFMSRFMAEEGVCLTCGGWVPDELEVL